ncbi:MAG: 6-hydroxymethylpterin diphosphokinase MptE-like protein [Planctomycetota bacterium]
MLTLTRGSSRRCTFAPCESDLLRKNLAALWSRDPKTAEPIDAVADEPYPIEATPDGGFTVEVDSQPLHSRRRPLAEAKRLAEEFDPEQALCGCIYGGGLMHHVVAAIERLADDAKLLVVEPDPRLIATAFTLHDFAEELGSGKLSIRFGNDEDDLLSALRPWSTAPGIGSATISHAPSLRRHPDIFLHVARWTEKHLTHVKTQVMTAKTLSRVTARNTVGHLKNYITGPGMEPLAGLHKGQPAILISAGPSLRKNKHLLKDAQGKAVLIAVQTALKPMIEMGVTPDYVTSLDYHEACKQFFEELPPTLSTHLVAEPKISPRIPQLHPGSISLNGNTWAEQVLTGSGLRERSAVPQRSTVAHLAFHLAVHLGCDPIIMVGQDLGFSDGIYYLPGTAHESVWNSELGRFASVEMRQWERIVRDRAILRKTVDVHGRPIYTEPRMITYLQQFEADFAECRATIVDATEGGVAKRFTTPMPLAEALTKYCTKPLPKADPNLSPRTDAIPHARRAIRDRVTECGNIADCCERILAKLRLMIASTDDQRRMNRLIAEIDPIRAELSRNGVAYELITTMIQKDECTRVLEDWRINAVKLDPVERQRRQVERDLSHVENIRGAALELGELLDGVADELGGEAREAA